MSGAGAGLAAGIEALRESLAAAAATGAPCLPRGAGTKDALSAADGASPLDLAGLTGVVEYEPSEFTVTALAGTPVAALEAELRRNGQYLPFDPILVEAGATLGGTLAAGVSGPGRARYGGLRDFVLGIQLLDGEGRLVRGGGKVVKNAAGFDLPKLMVGSLGSLGVVVEATLKVFPAPEGALTGRIDLGGIELAVAAMRRVLAGPSEVDALELEPPGRLWIRMAGRERALAARLERALALAAGTDRSAGAGHGGEMAVVERDAADAHWRSLRELTWVPADTSLFKVPLQPGLVAGLDRALAAAADGGAVTTRYGAAGQQALVAWPAALPIMALERVLDDLGLAAVALRGSAGRRRLGRLSGEPALERVRGALDPEHRFLDP